MRYTLVGLCLSVVLLCSGGARADEPLPPFPVGMQLTSTANCEDPTTKEHGLCAFWQDSAGNTYLLFGQGDKLRFIRQYWTDGTPYVNMWVADDYGTF